MSAHNTLRGRDAECAALDVLLDAARSGESRTVVLRGEAGVGKTALLDYAIGSAQDFRVLRSVGVESEMELAFASLHQLCAPILDRRDSLPGPQREALEVVFGLDSGPAPDRFLVGLATLSLLAETADERPLLCVIDDAQWLDSASALAFAFVARRLLAEPISLVFAVREPIDVRELVGLPELMIGGLSEDDARVLLDSALPGRLDERVRDRIVAESRGNPLALLELPRGLTPGELAGGFAASRRAAPGRTVSSGASSGRFGRSPPIHNGCCSRRRRSRSGDVSLLWRAAERLGLGPDAAAPAEAAGLIELGARVRFRHPLVRSAVYRAASPPDRRADPSGAGRVDRCRTSIPIAEHGTVRTRRRPRRGRRRGTRAFGRAGPGSWRHRGDGRVPRARGGADAGSRPPRRARPRARHRRSSTPGRSSRRPLSSRWRRPDPPTSSGCARIDLLHAQIAFAKSRGNEATPLLLAAARRLERLDVALARETYLDAVAAAIFAGRLARGPGLREVGDGGARRAAAAAAAGARQAAGCPCRASHGRLLGIGADDGASPRERSVTRRSPSRRRCAGSGLHRSSLRICGTTSAGSWSQPVT